MASKKSKVLAIAFCAAVMSGIYANPVLAKPVAEPVYVENGSVTITSKMINSKYGVTIAGIASQDAVDEAQQAAEDAQKTANDLKKDFDRSKIKDHQQDGRLAELENNDNLQDQAIEQIQNDIKNFEDTDTNTQVKEGTYEADADGTVKLDVIDTVNNTVKEDAITIEGLASDDELSKVDAKADKAQQTAEDAATLAGGALSTAKEVKEDLANETTARQEADDALRNELNGNIEYVAGEIMDVVDEQGETLEAQGEQIDKNTQAIKDETTARKEADDALRNELNGNIEYVAGQIMDVVDEQGDILDAHGQQIGDNTAAIKNHTSVIGVEDYSQLKTEYADTNYISGANDMVEADVILDREISNVNSRVDGIESRVDGLEDRIDKVGAMAAAIANLRTMGYDPAAPTEVAVGVGQYRDETGMALGLFHYPNRDFMLSLSVSTSGDEYMGGIGATWKFGRKSPEKVAEIKKAQAEADARRAEEQKLAKAEEMKKAAKEAKVQAQMERHAKLAAERAALEEA